MNAYLDVTPEIARALNENQPIVALESTIISHGMPYPQNVETALKVEAAVREKGAIPATIAIINGRLKAGLSTDEVEMLGKAGHAAAKVSRRDMSYIVANQLMGATTVATTMMIAHMAGIKVFATGGIGGVHRGAAQTFDISADLQELAQTPVTVVCAGAKSILDLGLTLEYLETHGVPVIGYQTKQLPAFFTQTSRFDVDYQIDSAEAIAQVMLAQHAMQLKSGMVVANPIPTEFAMASELIDKAIEQALSEADAQNIQGKQATPFLLARVCELTGGDSLASNIQLVLNNARLAADIATAYCHHTTV